MRYALWPLLLTSVCGCSSPARPFNGADALANLQAQAPGVERAMIQEDHQRMADLTHPALVNHFGGRSEYIKMLASIAAELRGQGLKFHSFRFGEPSQIFESAGQLYAIYPYTGELTGPDGKRGGQPSYLVCISNDGGSTWKFLDGAGAGSDRSKVQRFLPDFPAELTLPELGPLVVQP